MNGAEFMGRWGHQRHDEWDQKTRDQQLMVRGGCQLVDFFHNTDKASALGRWMMVSNGWCSSSLLSLNWSHFQDYIGECLIVAHATASLILPVLDAAVELKTPSKLESEFASTLGTSLPFSLVHFLSFFKFVPAFWQSAFRHSKERPRMSRKWQGFDNT